MKRTLSFAIRALTVVGVFAAIGASTVAQQRQRQVARPLPNPSAESAQQGATPGKERSVTKEAMFDRIAEKVKVTGPQSHENRLSAVSSGPIGWKFDR
jgi:hypothetical protein